MNLAIDFYKDTKSDKRRKLLKEQTIKWRRIVFNYCLPLRFYSYIPIFHNQNDSYKSVTINLKRFEVHIF